MLPGVNLFASGTYRGKRWPPARIREMAENARKLGPGGLKLLVPPGVLGHEEGQDWLDRTDLPAAGWVDPDSVKVAPDPDNPGELILKGDVVNIPPQVKREKLDTGEYRFGSSEIYDDFKDDFGRSYGKALRRFALLGGEVPQVKRLGPLPAPVPMAEVKKFAERPGRKVIIRERVTRRGRLTHTYAETSVMDRTQMMAAAQAAMPGLSQAFLDALSDDQLAELVKNLPSPDAGAGSTQNAGAAAGPGASSFADDPNADPNAGGDDSGGMTRDDYIAALSDMGQDESELEGMSDDELAALYDEMSQDDDSDDQGAGVEEMGDPASMTREDMIAELVAQGQDPAQLDGMSDDDLRNLYAQLTGGATAAAPAAPAQPAAAMGDRGRANCMGERGRGRGKPKTPKRVSAMSEGVKLKKKARQLYDELETSLQETRRANYEAKKQDAVAFCDRLVAEERATPALVQATILPALLGLDNTRRVHKYSENGQTRNVSAYEQKKIELAKLPKVVKFGERFPKDPAAAKGRREAEVGKVERFAEVQGQALRAHGTDPKKLVEAAKKMAEADPDFTAAKLLGADAAAMVG
jgi:hypothetical protein